MKRQAFWVLWSTLMVGAVLLGEVAGRSGEPAADDRPSAPLLTAKTRSEALRSLGEAGSEAGSRSLGEAGNEAPPVEALRSFSEAGVRRMLVTAYCPCAKCCGDSSDGITASGQSVRANGGKFVAADTRVLPFHTKLSIPGYNAGRPVPVLDRGGAIKGDRLDVFFPSHAAALRWGRQWLNVTVMP